MSKKETLFGSLCLFLVLLAYVIPYGFLSGVTVWYGSFLIWIVLALLIIIINFILTRNWK
ncbi:hypothetical protein [Ferdinandcohnia sp. Marseille-Q9671]